MGYIRYIVRWKVDEDEGLYSIPACLHGSSNAHSSSNTIYQYHRPDWCTLYRQGRHFNFFLGAKFFFSMPPDYWKIGKKQHFICSNLTLFIVPFFLSFFFLLFFFLFFFFFLFSFFFFLGGGGRRPPSPLQMTPLCTDYNSNHSDIARRWGGRPRAIEV